MKSTKPYLLEAMRRWIIDSDCTPQVFVRTDILGVSIPEGYDKDGHILLNISDDAVDALEITEHVMTFEASFGEVPYSIRLPMPAIISINAAENNVVLEFNDDAVEEEGEEEGGDVSASGKPDLRVL